MNLAEAPQVKAHPHTLKYFKQGHPWATLDSWSARWPKNQMWVQIEGQACKYFLLHDPENPKIVGRVWQRLVSNEQPLPFTHELERRLRASFERRSTLVQEKLRENFYLAFAEADGLPGLFILNLGPILLVQSKTRWWEKQKSILKEVLLKILSEKAQDFPYESVVFERREDSARAQREIWHGSKLPEKSLIKEYGIQYQLHWGEHYDHGLYTDMSSIRPLLATEMKQARVLNLYAYTGAFSLYALAQGAKQVVSVDMGELYLHWLDENLQLNPDLLANGATHQSLLMPVSKALSLLAKQEQKFDFVVSDPPSFSSDGRQSSSAFAQYPQLIQQCASVLAPGGKMGLFLNTHQISRAKFRAMVLSQLVNGAKLKILREFKLGLDAVTLKGHPEGDYLKGVLLSLN